MGSKNKPYVYSGARKTKVTYLVGDGSPARRPETDFLIYQNIYPALPGIDPELSLPSAAFSEAEGTFVNGEGRIQRVKKIVDPPGDALPDWDILCRIAKKMGKSGFEFNDAAEIQKEMSEIVAGYGDVDAARMEVAELPLGNGAESDATADAGSSSNENSGDHSFVLSAAVSEHTYKGLPLQEFVPGTRELFVEGVVEISPEDAASAGISEGDEVIISSNGFEKTLRASLIDEQPPGSLCTTLDGPETDGRRTLKVNIRKKDV